MICTHKYDDGRDAMQGDCTGVTCRRCGIKMSKDEYVESLAHAYGAGAENERKASINPPEAKSAPSASTEPKKRGKKAAE